MDLAGARRWRLGPRRRTGLAVPSVLCRRLAGPAARRAARCAGAVPRIRPRPHARAAALPGSRPDDLRSEEHTSALPSLMSNQTAVLRLKTKINTTTLYLI